MALLSYQLTVQEWKNLKKVTGFAVDIYCALRKADKTKLSARAIQHISGTVINLCWKSYLQQIVSDKKTEKSLSRDSIEIFCKYFDSLISSPENKKFLGPEGQLPEAVTSLPEYDKVKHLHGELSKSFRQKIRLKKLAKKKIKEREIGFEEPENNDGNDVLKSFEGTRWHCFENCEKGLARKILTFNEFDSDTSLSVTFRQAEEGSREWQGSARCDYSQEFLIINLVNKKTRRNYTHFMIRLDDNHKSMTVCSGHKTYEHLLYKNIVTKTVILQKVKDDAELGIAQELSRDDPSIDWGIREFLQNRLRNRMSSPRKKVIVNLEVLREWISKSRERQEEIESELPKKLTGVYHLFYRIWPYGEPGLQKDIISLKETGVEYLHELSPNKPIKWEGFAICNFITKTLTVNLYGPVGTSSARKRKPDSKDKPVFVMLSIPPEETEEFDTLVGVAAGVRDQDNGAVGRAVVAIKLEDNGSYPTNFDIQKLEDFFDAYAERSWARPPAQTRVFMFRDIKRAMPEGLEYQQQVKQRYRE